MENNKWMELITHPELRDYLPQVDYLIDPQGHICIDSEDLEIILRSVLRAIEQGSVTDPWILDQEMAFEITLSRLDTLESDLF